MIKRIVALLLGLSSRAYLNNLLFHGRDDVKDSLQKKKSLDGFFFILVLHGHESLQNILFGLSGVCTSASAGFPDAEASKTAFFSMNFFYQPRLDFLFILELPYRWFKVNDISYRKLI